jgi:Zn-dependent M28 family amino/carboxypeptidase
MNILGYVEGSDPDLKDEFIVIGAHVDHLGEIEGHIFHGANDNASGSSVVMEIAEAFSLLEEAPKRSILFILFTAEEMGLMGSSYYVDNPAIPLSNMKAMINLDMVGSGDDAVMIVGGHSFPGFAQIFDTVSSKYIHVSLKRRWTSANSDHYSFHRAGIPSVFLYALRGVPTYHSSRDRYETLDAEVMERVGRLVFLTVLELANSEKVEFKYVEKE